MSLIICKKCFIGVQAEEYSQMIEKSKAAVPERDRCKDHEYVRRISVCEQCEFFTAATCRACGCYVELRALKSGTHCPKKKW